MPSLTCVHVIHSLNVAHQDLVARGLVCEMGKGLGGIPLVFVDISKVVVVLAVRSGNVGLHRTKGPVRPVHQLQNPHLHKLNGLWRMRLNEGEGGGEEVSCSSFDRFFPLSFFSFFFIICYGTNLIEPFCPFHGVHLHLRILKISITILLRINGNFAHIGD